MHASPFSPSFDPLQETIRSLQVELHGLFHVSGVGARTSGDEAITFTGRYPHKENGPYDEIRRRFRAHGYTPVLRRRNDQDVLLALKGVTGGEKTGNPLLNVLLLLVTILTTLSAGATLAGQNSLFAALLESAPHLVLPAVRAGAPFAITLLSILGVHELGHYVAARWHGVSATLPYFIPMPVGGLGTLGAFISVRSPMKNRTVLFDIGLAGPIAGFVVALPLLVVGLLLSEPVPVYTPGLTLRVLGSSLLVDAVTGLLVDVETAQTLALHPIFFAAWFGVLITGINLLPIGQLDGGHVAYGLLGRNAHHVARGTLVLLLVAGFTLSSTWLLWALFVLFGGLHHPPPLNDITGVDGPRKLMGLLAAGLFFLIITPVPFLRF